MNAEKIFLRAEKQCKKKNYDAALKTLDELKILNEQKNFPSASC